MDVRRLLLIITFLVFATDLIFSDVSNGLVTRMMFSKIQNMIDSREASVIFVYYDEEGSERKFVRLSTETYTVLSGKKFSSKESEIKIDENYLYFKYTMMSFIDNKTEYYFEIFLPINQIKRVSMDNTQNQLIIYFLK